MTLPIDLVLVRHGESDLNLAIRRSKNGDDSIFTPEFRKVLPSDWRLTDKGQVQAEISGEWVKNHVAKSFDRYYVSDYVRALETAAYLGFNDARWYREPYLRERNWGELGTLPYHERNRMYADEIALKHKDPYHWMPPRGESLAQVVLRVDRVLDTLHRECSGQRVLIVGHGELIWAFRIRIERLLPVQYRTLKLNEKTDTFNWIRNGHVVHYTRKDPLSDAISPHVGWVRSLCPSDLWRSVNDFRRIERRTFSTEELLTEVEQYPQFLS